MNTSLQVAHVVRSLDAGPATQTVLALLRAGRRAGHRHEVICLEYGGSEMDAAIAGGATVACVGKPPGLQPATVGHLQYWFRRWQPDVVHTHHVAALLYGGLAARSLDVPLVLHGEYAIRLSWRPELCLLACVAARYADRVLCASPQIAAEWTGWHIVPRGKVCVAPVGAAAEYHRLYWKLLDGSRAMSG